MPFNSRAIALLLSACVAAVTTAFLSLATNVPSKALGITGLLSLCSTYILTQIVLELLFFRQIDDIYNHLKKTKGMGLSLKEKPMNPLKRIFRELIDYAERKQEEINRLKELEGFRREFIADVSHELKTPLFAAQGFVHTLLDGAISDKDVRKKFLKKAAKSLDGLDLLVQDILTLSQIESGEIKMHFENFDIAILCHEVLDQLEGKAKKKGVSLFLSTQVSSPIIVRGDYLRVYQVMMNLLSNAIKYTKKGGQAKVSFKDTGGKIRTIIEDNGRGIPASDTQRIFERFYRVEKSRSREKGGTGLGLSIVKHILERHNAEIFVESELKGGSKFYFDLEKAEYIEREIEEYENDEDYI